MPYIGSTSRVESIVYSRATPGGWPAWRSHWLKLTPLGPPLAAGLRRARTGFKLTPLGPPLAAGLFSGITHSVSHSTKSFRCCHTAVTPSVHTMDVRKNRTHAMNGCITECESKGEMPCCQV